MTTADLITLLKTKVRDTTNAYWTAGEMSDAVDEALRDISTVAEDTSLTASTSTQDYTIPSTIDRVLEVRITSGSTKALVDNEAWTQIGTTLRFDQYPPINGAIILTGVRRMASTDDIPADKVNCVLYGATYKLWELLAEKYATGLLMSDITLAEINSGMDRFEQKFQKEFSKIKKQGYSF